STKLRRRNCCQFFLQQAEVLVHAVAFPPAGRAGASATPSQRQMRTKRMLLQGDSESVCLLVNPARKLCQAWPGFQPNPEDPRGFCSRKEAISAKLEIESLSLDLRQNSGNVAHCLFRFLSDELQSNVQRLGAHPTCVGREPSNTVHKLLDSFADGV